jgi:epsin
MVRNSNLATHNYQHFQNIMNTVYMRLQEACGPNWRQTYKALQLLEFLVLNGSEQVIDHARRHVYEIKALENYQYVDEKRKDQGINSKYD